METNKEKSLKLLNSNLKEMESYNYIELLNYYQGICKGIIYNMLYIDMINQEEYNKFNTQINNSFELNYKRIKQLI